MKAKTLSDILKDIYDEADHIIATEAKYDKEVAIVNSKKIKKLAKLGLKLIEVIRQDLTLTNNG